MWAQVDWALGRAQDEACPIRLTLVECYNDLNAVYAADAYARARGIGACVIVGGSSILNAMAGAFRDNIPVVCIVGYGTNHILSEELCSSTCLQAVVDNMDDSAKLIDTAISTALKKSKPVYISVSCNLWANRVPSPLTPKLSYNLNLEEAVEVAGAVKPVLVGDPKMPVAKACDEFVKLADTRGDPLVVSTIHPSPVLSDSAGMTLASYIALWLVEFGIRHIFAVSDKFNKKLLDQLVAEPRFKLVHCSNEFNARSSAFGYARAQGIGVCLMTTTLGGNPRFNPIAYRDNLPVLCIVGGGVLPAFSKELHCFETRTNFQPGVNITMNVREFIDELMLTALKDSEPVYITLTHYLSAILEQNFPQPALVEPPLAPLAEAPPSVEEPVGECFIVRLPSEVLRLIGASLEGEGYICLATCNKLLYAALIGPGFFMTRDSGLHIYARWVLNGNHSSVDRIGGFLMESTSALLFSELFAAGGTALQNLRRLEYYRVDRVKTGPWIVDKHVLSCIDEDDEQHEPHTIVSYDARHCDFFLKEGHIVHTRIAREHIVTNDDDDIVGSLATAGIFDMSKLNIASNIDAFAEVTWDGMEHKITQNGVGVGSRVSEVHHNMPSVVYEKLEIEEEVYAIMISLIH